MHNTNRKIRKVIFDTDPSPDDAVAFIAAIASPEELEVLAITTVAGNVPLELTAKNARKALELAGREEIPVYAGASAPLVRPLVTAEHVHGRTGFDGYDLPEPKTPLAPGFAPDAIVDLVMSHPAGEVTLCCLAPLTNIALAMAREGALVVATDLREFGLINPCGITNRPVTSRPRSATCGPASMPPSATRCCSASPARARPSPWRR